MSRENLEVVRSLAAAFEERRVEALREHCAPDMEWHEDPSFPEAGVYRGLAAPEAYARQFLAQFSEIHYEPLEMRDSGDHVIVRMRITGVGKASGARFEMSAWWATTIRNGKIVRCFAYLDREQALEAIGLRK
jgi:ketosteroid isomerase-like protein